VFWWRKVQQFRIPALGAKPNELVTLLPRLKKCSEKPHPCKKRKDGPPNFKGHKAAIDKDAAMVAD